jgi:D-glycero-D-manno-heptose 1,7-bisphosphate phosphatase
MVDSPFTIEQFKLRTGVKKAIKILNKLNYKTMIVSNQPGIARNHFTEKTLKQMDKKLKEELSESNAYIDAIYYCPHDPKGENKKYRKKCDCRKPKPGLIIKASKDHDINLKESYMIGDELLDIQAGKTANCKTILIGRMKCHLCKIMDEKNIYPDVIKSSLLEAAEYIKKENEK